MGDAVEGGVGSVGSDQACLQAAVHGLFTGSVHGRYWGVCRQETGRLL